MLSRSPIYLQVVRQRTPRDYGLTDGRGGGRRYAPSVRDPLRVARESGETPDLTRSGKGIRTLQPRRRFHATRRRSK